MEKTIKDWYNKLPYQIRKEALKNTPEDMLTESVDCLSQSIKSAFLWEITPQGNDFWASVVYVIDYLENK